MRHAREVAELLWPGAPQHAATKAVTWIPARGGASQGARFRPISRQEDLFGVFDLIVLNPATVELVQVTTWAPSQGAASSRRRKIRLWLEEQAPLDLSFYGIRLWAWEARRGFRTWVWVGSWERGPILVKSELRTRTVP